MNAQLAGARAKQISPNANVIAQVEQLPQLKSGISDGVFLHVDLEPLPILLQMCKSSLAHQTDRHNPSRDAHGHSRRLEFLGSLPTVFAQNLRHNMAEVVLAWIGRVPESLNLFDLLAPYLIDVVVECQCESSSWKNVRTMEAVIINGVSLGNYV